MPFANYFANLIVSETQLLTGTVPCKPESVARFLKPCGGAAILGQPMNVSEKSELSQTEGVQWITEVFRIDEGELSSHGAWTVVRRGKLPGASSWTHQYGDRRDEGRQDWFGFPRPKTVERLEFVFDIQPQFSEGGGWYSQNPDSLNMPSYENPWLFASGARGLERFQIPLLGVKDAPATYRVKLFFADMSIEQVAALDVKFQGRDAVGTAQQLNLTNASDADTTSPSDPTARKNTSVIVKEFSDVVVENDLVVDLKSPARGTLSNLTAIEVIRNDAAKSAGGE